MRPIALMLAVVLFSGCGAMTLGRARTSCSPPVPFFAPPSSSPLSSMNAMLEVIARQSRYQQCLAAERRERAALRRIARLEREVAELRASARASAVAPPASAAPSRAPVATRSPVGALPPPNPFGVASAARPGGGLAPNPYDVPASGAVLAPNPY